LFLGTTIKHEFEERIKTKSRVTRSVMRAFFAQDVPPKGITRSAGWRRAQSRNIKYSAIVSTTRDRDGETGVIPAIPLTSVAFNLSFP